MANNIVLAGIARAALTSSVPVLATTEVSADVHILKVTAVSAAGVAPTQVVAGLDSTGAGIFSQAMIAQTDEAAVVAGTENQFSPVRSNLQRVLYVENGRYTIGRATADQQIKATAGFVHTVSISPSGSVTAGVLTLYDSAAESGTILAVFSLPVTTFTPFTVTLDCACATGIFVGFDATLANVSCSVSFR